MTTHIFKDYFCGFLLTKNLGHHSVNCKMLNRTNCAFVILFGVLRYILQNEYTRESEKEPDLCILSTYLSMIRLVSDREKCDNVQKHLFI